MLGYFAFYGSRYGDLLRPGSRADEDHQPWWQASLPAEIAARLSR